MPEAALRVQKQFWKPLARWTRRLRMARRYNLDGMMNPLGGVETPFGMDDAWRPTRLFANNEVGVWFDPSDLSTMFQDAAGTTPVTGVEQPVGLHLDKSKGLAIGAELVQNTDFAADTWWGKGAGWTISGGTANANTAGVAGLTSGALGLTAGRWYIVRFTATVTSGNISAFLGGTAAKANFTTGSYAVYVIAGSSNDFLTFDTLNACVATIDNVSVKSIAGNHRYQGTSAARPTLSARYNLLTKTEDISHSDWNKNKVSITTDATVSPDGNLSADKLVDTVDNAIHQIFQQVGTATTHTFSVCAKAAELSAIVLRFYGAPNNWECAVFDLSNGTNSQNASGSSTAFTNVTRSITSIGNGWYRCSLTATFASGTRPCAVHLSNAASGLSFNFNGENLYTGNGTSGVYLWGADCRPTNDGVGLPTYQRVNTSTDYDTAGFPMYLKYDGTDDFMQTASVDFSATDAVSIFAGARKLADTTTGMLIELTTNAGSTAGAFAVLVPENTTTKNAAIYSRGSVATAAAAFGAAVASPVTTVIGATAKISTDSQVFRENGTQIGTSAYDQGAGNYSNAVLYFGARAGTSLFFNGREYQTAIVGRTANSNEIASAEAFTNTKTKAA